MYCCTLMCCITECPLLLAYSLEIHSFSIYISAARGLTSPPHIPVWLKSKIINGKDNRTLEHKDETERDVVYNNIIL